jgi:signal transduction histidine kinase
VKDAPSRRFRPRLIPDTLGGRIVLVLLVGLLTFHVGSLWLHQVGTDTLLGSTRERQTAERLAAAKRAVADLPVADRDRTAHALSSASLDMHWTPAPTVRLIEETSPRIEALRTRLVELVPELRANGLRLGYAEDGTSPMPDGEQFRHVIIGAVALPDGSWLNFSAGLFRPPTVEHASLLSTTAMAVGILILGLFVVRLIGRPLRELSDAADRVGQPGQAVTMPESGPYEVRHAAQAFNRMQARINKLILDRTQALAAVSHDLRTPIARLRLRAGFLEDREAQRQIDADLDEMDAMIGATLAYLRGEEELEPERPTDLVALLETLCDDAADAGGDVRFEGPGQARLDCRPVAIKRAFSNVIENALKYGKAARVRLDDAGSQVVVRIDDDGPGIPEADHEAVFEPFRRLDPSRNRGTGGTGLGLTIARQVIGQHGGTVQLANRPAGGLSVRVELPRARRRPADASRP